MDSYGGLIINQHTNRIDRYFFPFLSDLTLKCLSFRYPVLRSTILQIYSSYLNDPCAVTRIRGREQSI